MAKNAEIQDLRNQRDELLKSLVDVLEYATYSLPRNIEFNRARKHARKLINKIDPNETEGLKNVHGTLLVEDRG